jgi:predicted nucleic acid-binding protein
MNVLIDTNVVLDVLICREPFFELSQLVLLASEQKIINGFVAASAVTDIFYVTNKHLKNKDATYKLLREHLMGTISIAPVDDKNISDALDLGWDDFEDCVQYVVGESIVADFIVTRNPKDFKLMWNTYVSQKNQYNREIKLCWFIMEVMLWLKSLELLCQTVLWIMAAGFTLP